MGKFVPNPDFNRELKATPTFQRALHVGAEAAAAQARLIAPRHTGAYARSIEVADVDGHPVIKTTDPFGHLVEFGSANNVIYAPLRRGVRAAGLRFTESPKP